MNDYDTFYTILYKGLYINAKYDRQAKREVFSVKGEQFNSLLSAKRKVTKLLTGKTKSV